MGEILHVKYVQQEITGHPVRAHVKHALKVQSVLLMEWKTLHNVLMASFKAVLVKHLATHVLLDMSAQTRPVKIYVLQAPMLMLVL